MAANFTSIPINMRLQVTDGIPRLVAKYPFVKPATKELKAPVIRDKASIGRDLINAALRNFGRDRETMPSVDLLRRLQEGGEWKEVEGKPFTLLLMSKVFRPLGIKPGNLANMKRGYRKCDLISSLNNLE